MEQKMITQIKEIINNYFICKNQYALSKFSSGMEDYSNPYYLYIRDVELALFSLNYDERNIVSNDFFYSCRSSWWKEQYEKREYLQIKKDAVSKFVRNFYEIH